MQTKTKLNWKKKLQKVRIKEPSVLRKLLRSGHVILWESNGSNELPDIIAEFRIALYLPTNPNYKIQ